MEEHGGECRRRHHAQRRASRRVGDLRERREALPTHPVPGGLAAPETWRLRVDGLVAQPLALSISEVDALGTQTHTADFVCDEGWMVPEQQWDGVAVAAILGRAGVQPEARFLKVYAGDFTVLLPLEEALTGGPSWHAVSTERRSRRTMARRCGWWRPVGRAFTVSSGWIGWKCWPRKPPPPGSPSPATGYSAEADARRPALTGCRPPAPCAQCRVAPAWTGCNSRLEIVDQQAKEGR